MACRVGSQGDGVTVLGLRWESKECHVHRLSLPGFQREATFGSHGTIVTAIAIPPDGWTLATATGGSVGSGQENAVRIWDLRRPEKAPKRIELVSKGIPGFTVADPRCPKDPSQSHWHAKPSPGPTERSGSCGSGFRVAFDALD